MRMLGLPQTQCLAVFVGTRDLLYLEPENVIIEEATKLEWKLGCNTDNFI